MNQVVNSYNTLDDDDDNDLNIVSDIIISLFKIDHFYCMCCVNVYCRAPVLVALALIELGMKYEDAVELIRQ